MAIPEEELGAVAVFAREIIEPREIEPGSLYVGLENVESDGKFRGVRPVGQGDIASSKFAFSEKHLLYGKLRPYLRKIALPDFAGVCSTDILPILPGPRLDRRYLFHFLRQDSLVGLAASRATGLSLPRLSPSTLQTFRVPVPALHTQQRIAAILDQADALRAKRRVALAKRDSLIEAIFLETFVTHETIWPQATVEQISTSMRTGPFGSQLLHSEFVESGVAVLGIDNAVENRFVWAKARYVTERKFQQLERYRVFPGDVLITIMATCGRCAIVPEDIPLAINSKHLCCITLDQTKCLSRYLHACFLLHPHVLRQLGVKERGAVMPGLNMGVIKELSIPLPPLDLQLRFSAQLEQIEHSFNAQERGSSKMDALFNSLQHAAFRGEL